ncbi:MAG: hypothetical protein WBO38_08600, partial [Chitinophagaceae bacterium]
PYAIPTMSVMMYDAKGSLVMQTKDAKGTGKKLIDLSVSKLSTGKYYISVYDNQKLLGTAELIRL